MARILITGGAGHMGRRAATALLDAGHEVTVGDLRPAPDDRAGFIELDARNREDLVSAMSDAEVVLNFVGPYYRFGGSIAEAAIEAGRPYVDVCDDADVTETLLELDDRAREAGVPVVIGAGMSPGVLNAVAQVTAADFDDVDEILTTWVVDERTESGPAPLDHFFHCMSGEIPIWADGRRQLIKPFTDETAERFPFPEPIGPVEVRDIGHPETVTLPRAVTARSVRNKGALLPEHSAPIFRMLAGIGLLSDTEVTVGDATVRARDFVVRYLTDRHNERISPEARDRSAMGVRVTGNRGGRDAMRHVTFAGHLQMADGTALPAAAAAEIVLDGHIPAGVNGPEILGAARWFEKLGAHVGDALDDFRVWDGPDESTARTLTLLEVGQLGDVEGGTS